VEDDGPLKITIYHVTWWPPGIKYLLLLLRDNVAEESIFEGHDTDNYNAQPLWCSIWWRQLKSIKTDNEPYIIFKVYMLQFHWYVQIIKHQTVENCILNGVLHFVTKRQFPYTILCLKWAYKSLLRNISKALVVIRMLFARSWPWQRRAN
jgi:hypothetical protein